MVILAWVIFGYAIGSVVYVAIYAAVECRKLERESKKMKAKFLADNSSHGLDISKPGLGWVPADAKFRRF